MNNENRNEIHAILKAGLSACVNAQDLGNLQREYLSQLGALFYAIIAMHKEPDTSIHHLACLGSSLCEDWANMVDCEVVSTKLTTQELARLIQANGPE